MFDHSQPLHRPRRLLHLRQYKPICAFAGGQPVQRQTTTTSTSKRPTPPAFTAWEAGGTPLAQTTLISSSTGDTLDQEQHSSRPGDDFHLRIPPPPRFSTRSALQGVHFKLQRALLRPPAPGHCAPTKLRSSRSPRTSKQEPVPRPRHRFRTSRVRGPAAASTCPSFFRTTCLWSKLCTET